MHAAIVDIGRIRFGAHGASCRLLVRPATARSAQPSPV